MTPLLGAAFSYVVGATVLDNVVPINKDSDFGDIVLRGVAESSIGGTAAMIGGGKFSNGAYSAAFVYAYNETFSHGFTIEVPGFVRDALNYIIGDDSNMMGNGGSIGYVVQYPGPTAREDGWDFGIYMSVSYTNDVNFPIGNAFMGEEISVGLGSIHGNFTGRSDSLELAIGKLGIGVGGTQNFNQPYNIDSVTLNLGLGIGVSGGTQFTRAVTIRDGVDYMNNFMGETFK